MTAFQKLFRLTPNLPRPLGELRPADNGSLSGEQQRLRQYNFTMYGLKYRRENKNVRTSKYSLFYTASKSFIKTFTFDSGMLRILRALPRFELLSRALEKAPASRQDVHPLAPASSVQSFVRVPFQMWPLHDMPLLLAANSESHQTELRNPRCVVQASATSADYVRTREHKAILDLRAAIQHLTTYEFSQRRSAVRTIPLVSIEPQPSP